MKKILLITAMIASTIVLGGCVEAYHTEYYTGPETRPALYPPPELTGYNSDYKPGKHLKKQQFYSSNQRRMPQPPPHAMQAPGNAGGYHSSQTPSGDGYYSSNSQADNGYYSDQKPKKRHKRNFYSSNGKKHHRYYSSKENKNQDEGAPEDNAPNGGYSSGGSGAYHS